MSYSSPLAELQDESLNSEMEIHITRTKAGRWKVHTFQGPLFAAIGTFETFKDAWVTAHLSCPLGGDVSSLIN